MELQTVSTVSKKFGISTRMLRYYEQIGLIESKRKENYSYRVYDDTAVRRLRQIILLRKLRIPVKQIKDILEKQEITATIVEIFQHHINELNEEISALSAIRDILGSFIKMLGEKTDIKVTFDLLSDEFVSNVIASLKLPKNYIKEESSIMEELIKTNEMGIAPIEVEFGYGILPLVNEKQGSNFLTERIPSLKQKIAADIGVVINYIAFTDNVRLSPNSYVIKIKGEEVAAGEIMPSYYLIMEYGVTTEHEGIFADMDGIETKEPAYEIPAKWIHPASVEKAKTLGYVTVDPLSVIMTHLNEIIKKHANDF